MRRIALAASFVVAAMAAAQTADSARVSLREAQVVTNRATRQTPIAFSNIDREAIAAQNRGQDLPFLLSTQPSVLTTSDAGSGIGYTAIRVRGTDATRINVTSNGIPMNDAESHGLFWVNMGDFASSLNSIQLQRGVGTSTNGAGAFGASLNLLTDKAAQHAYASYDGAVGSFNTTKNTVKFGSGILASGWAIDGRVSHIASSGYRDRASANLGSYFAQATHFAPATMFKLIAFGGKERTYHAWDGISRAQLRFDRRYNPNGDMGDGKFYANQMDNYFQQHAQALLTHQYSPALTLSAALHYTYGHGFYEEYKQNRKFADYGISSYLDNNGTEVKRSDLVREKHLKNHFFGGIASINYRKGGLDLNFGAGLNYYSGKHYGYAVWVKDTNVAFDPTKPYYDSWGGKADGNVYLRAHYAPNKQVALFADVQYRHIDYRIDGTTDKGVPSVYANKRTGEFDLHERYNFVNPKVGITWNVAQRHQLYASWSVAHREPTRNNFTESLNLLTSGDFERPRAERLFDYEAGYRYTGSRLQASANAYWMQYRDQFVVNGHYNEIGEAVLENVRSSFRTGVELSAKWQVAKSFEWEANLALSANKIRNYNAYVSDADYTVEVLHHMEKTTIAMSPTAVFNNVFTYSHRGFSASLITQAVSRQYLDNFEMTENSLDAYCVSHLNLNYHFRPHIKQLREVSIGATIYNIFNEQYETNGYAGVALSDYNATTKSYRLTSAYSSFYPMAGTNFLLSLGLKF